MCGQNYYFDSFMHSCKCVCLDLNYFLKKKKRKCLQNQIYKVRQLKIKTNQWIFSATVTLGYGQTFPDQQACKEFNSITPVSLPAMCVQGNF